MDLQDFFAKATEDQIRQVMFGCDFSAPEGEPDPVVMFIYMDPTSGRRAPREPDIEGTAVDVTDQKQLPS